MPCHKKLKRTAADIATSVMKKTASCKRAAAMPEEYARNYFFSNPYGLDFQTWASMQDMEPEEPVVDPSYDESTSETPDVEAPVEEPEVAGNAPVPSIDPPVKAKKAPRVPTIKQGGLLSSALLRKVANGDEAGKPVDRRAVEAFLRTHANLEDSDFHSWAASQGYNTHAAEEVAYDIAHEKLSEDSIPGGKAQGMTNSDFDPKQMAMGQKVEREHTPDPKKQQEIARDHLEEFPDYYTALQQMEERLSQKKNASVLEHMAVTRLRAKVAMEASELLGQDEERKNQLHEQQLRHTEENHALDLQKGQLDLQQKQEQYQMKQQQQAQKDQVAQQQQAMMVQSQQQQQQAMKQQWMSNMAGGQPQQPQQPQQQPVR